jgi:hypothetical protein
MAKIPELFDKLGNASVDKKLGHSNTIITKSSGFFPFSLTNDWHVEI